MAAAIGPHPTLAMDLGTTHLLTAHYNQATSTNHSIPVQIDDTQSIDCSMTFLKGEVLIGLEAARLWKIVWPRRTVENWGYLVGMKYTDPRVARLQRHVPYHLGCDVDGTVIIELEESEGGPHMRIKPAELITIILKFAKENAEAYLSRTFPSVVLTIPSSISLSTRATILRAAHSAGFAHIRALTDATAAAVACMFHLHARKQTIHRRNVMIGAKDVSELLNENPVEKALLDKTDIVLSMNVGATHVDCAVLAVASGVYSVLATKGLTDTGASEVDYIIMEYFEELIPKAYPDSKPTRRDMHILFMNCENLKKALTYSHDTSLTVDFSFGPMELTLTREKMDFLAAAFYARCMVPLQQAVADANVDPMDITTVVLSGGGVKIPKLRDDVSFLFPNRLFRFVKLDPAKAVGFGASLEAALLEGVTAPPIKNYLLIDAASNTVALKTAFPHYKKSGRPATLYHPLISRNSPLPARGGCFVRGIRTEKGAMTMSGNVRIELWDEAAGERVCMVDVPVKAPHELAPDEVGREGMEMEVVETEDGGETVEVIMQEEGETASPSPSPPTTSTEPQPLAPLFYVLLTLSVDRVFNLKLYRLHPHQDLRRPQDWESGAEVSVNIDPWIGPTCWAREEAGEVWGVEVAEQIESGARGIVKEE